jgi:two-component sensor histidine kinase
MPTSDRRESNHGVDRHGDDRGHDVAELVMNSSKYAWAPDEAGRMVVTLRRHGELVEAQLWDNGRGNGRAMR